MQNEANSMPAATGENNSDPLSIGLEVKVDPLTGMKGLYTTLDVQKGGTVSPFLSKELLDRPTYLTVQAGKGQHILLQPTILQYTNHGCDPNVFFNTDEWRLEALRDIKAGEELRYFYPATEWRMDQPFSCACGSIGCRGVISGAYNLPAEVISGYKVTTFIKRMIQERDLRATR